MSETKEERKARRKAERQEGKAERREERRAQRQKQRGRRQRGGASPQSASGILMLSGRIDPDSVEDALEDADAKGAKGKQALKVLKAVAVAYIKDTDPEAYEDLDDEYRDLIEPEELEVGKVVLLRTGFAEVVEIRGFRAYMGLTEDGASTGVIHDPTSPRSRVVAVFDELPEPVAVEDSADPEPTEEQSG